MSLSEHVRGQRTRTVQLAVYDHARSALEHELRGRGVPRRAKREIVRSGSDGPNRYQIVRWTWVEDALVPPREDEEPT